MRSQIEELRTSVQKFQIEVEKWCAEVPGFRMLLFRRHSPQAHSPQQETAPCSYQHTILGVTLPHTSYLIPQSYSLCERPRKNSLNRFFLTATLERSKLSTHTWHQLQAARDTLKFHPQQLAIVNNVSSRR